MGWIDIAIVCELIFSDKRRNKKKRPWIKEWRQSNQWLYLLHHDVEVRYSGFVLLTSYTVFRLFTVLFFL